MDLATLYQENHEIIIGGSFTVIGVVIAWFLSFVQNYFQNRREQKLHVREKREQTYEKILSIYYTHCQEQKVPVKKLISQLPVMLEQIYPTINMWGSKEVKNVYNKVMTSKDNQEDLLIKTIREELGVKD